jgi:hypothetical protein
MENSNLQRGIIPASVLEMADNLEWEDITVDDLAGFSIIGTEAAPGGSCITLYGVYALENSAPYLINIFKEYEDDAVDCFLFQRAAVR